MSTHEASGLTETPVLVGIAGGSGSGKSSLARALRTALGPSQVACLSHDAYYRDRGALPAAVRAGVDYDVPEAFDQDLFLAHLAALRAGVTIRPPQYSFETHCRIGDGEPVEPRAVVLVDGILLLWDPAVRAALDLSIFLDVPERLRLQRRVSRDISERGRTTAGVLAQFDATVRPAHAAYVEPTRALADLVLGNLGRLEPLAEIASALILDRLARRARTRVGAV
jgi:uridine kinase